MVEKITVRRESEHTPERSRKNHEHHERIASHHEIRAKDIRHEHRDNLNEILTRIETSAKSSAELSSHHAPETKTDHRNPNFVGKQLKENQLKRSLYRIQKELKPYQRPFSRLIHNNAIELLSDTAEKTVARPDGLLVGGLLSFIASIAIFVICRYYGYEYNYFIGLISFPVGFGIGILSGFILKPLRHR